MGHLRQQVEQLTQRVGELENQLHTKDVQIQTLQNALDAQAKTEQTP
jgi:chaperonin cofactor prefoldin